MAGTDNRVVNLKSFLAMSKSLARSASEASGTMAKLTNIRGK
jgi:hypothetical protein